ncbi:MAG TPA: efflux RND transporter periplasmic adaptor subunit [Isosphaeraceae bacterium]|nr:efflux RND transporter periplasmic adaptor subunit [Isosphaeraceae bacterium]
MRFLVTSWQCCAVTSLLAVLAGCGAHGGAHPAEEEHTASGEAHVTVRTEPARSGVISVTVDALGRCDALPDRIATLTPAVEGHVHDLLVAQGDMVKKGQPIVEFDKAVAEADLMEKTASRDGLKASLVLLQSLPRPAERRANELAVETATVAVEQAKAVADRLRSLLARHEASDQQFIDAQRAVKQAEILKESAAAQLHAMTIGPRAEAVAEAEGKIKTADGLVAFSRAHLEYHTIRAPIDGVLDSLTCHPGQTIAIGNPIGEVVDTRQVFASVFLPPRSASAVKVGQSARVFPADALDHSTGASAAEKEGMTGKVSFVGRVADPQTGNLPIRILVDNAQGILTIGQSIRVSIVVDAHKTALQVPAAAILDLGEGPTLSIVRYGKSVVLHPEVGASHEGWTEVSGTDLKEGEPVIVEGGYNLPADTPVQVSGAGGGATAKPEAEKAGGATAKPEVEK